MPDDEFKLPASSLDEVEKIIEAFAQKGQPTPNDEVAQVAGINRSTVSRNNGFLASVNLVKGGQRKEPTELGAKLGHALHHGQAEDVARYWRESVMASAFLSDQLTAVRVQKGVKTNDLAGRVLYNSGATKNQYSQTGSRTVVDILVKAGLLVEEDGKYQVSKESGAPASPAASSVEKPKPAIEPPRMEQPSQPRNRALQVAVNIQLELPDFEDSRKYAELFKALREELLDPLDAED